MRVLIHVGIDTIKLGKRAFTLHVEEGSQVDTATLLLEADLEMKKRNFNEKKF